MENEKNKSKKNSQASLDLAVGKAMDYFVISIVLSLCLWAFISLIIILFG